MNYNTTYIQAPPQNHWIGFMFKFVGTVGGAALVATMLAGWVKDTGAPSANAPVAAQVRYYSKGIGRVGQDQHWMTQASEDTAQWQKAKAYCQSESAGQSAGQSGCGTINELANSGY